MKAKLDLGRVVQTIATIGCLSLSIASQLNSTAEAEEATTQSGKRVAAEKPNIEQDDKVIQTMCTDACCGGDCCKGTCCKNECCCKAVCCPKCVTEEVKKHCWLVKQKLICIPKFQFNLFSDNCSQGQVDCGDGCCSADCSSCAKQDCGRVRCINVLEKHEYTCEECGYEWEVKCVRTGKKRCCSKKCSCPSCGCRCKCCGDLDESATNLRLASAEDTTAADE